jgi:non-ribosomal peptide synthase protein (TIGR01720 family)
MVDSAVMHVTEEIDNFHGSFHDWTTGIQQSLKPQAGEVFKAVYIHSQKQQTRRLLLVLHHLVVDGVSWRILLQDIDTLYQQWVKQTTLMLPAKTSSYQQWANFLNEYANSETLQQELNHWQAQYATPVKRIRDSQANGGGKYQHEDQSQHHDKSAKDAVSFDLTEALTSQLLTQSNQTYRTQINELLLAGLLLGLQDFSGDASGDSSGISALRIDLEGHGREALTDSLDLSQTVGWFTSLYPLTLHADSHAISEIICAVKEQYRAIPNKGVGFGLLKYLAQDDSLSDSLSNTPASELLFNYLGQFDQVVNEETLFGGAAGSGGEEMSRNRRASHPLSLNAMVSDGRLQMTLAFEQQDYQQHAMQQQIDSIESSVEAVINHCVSTARGQYTPSDFPLAQVDSQTLNEWQQIGDIDDLYPASGMQQGLLFHSMLDSSSYVTQTVLTFEDLQVDLFQQAWQQVVQRHSIFRTAFVGLDAHNAHQLVLADVQLPWQFEDVSGLDSQARQVMLEAIRMADKTRGFTPTQAPLMRMTLIDLGVNDAQQPVQQLVWSHHHALLDGWCIPIVFGEVFG